MNGRLAPSPTGAQHLGNARTFLIAWLLARRSSSKLWLRIEDLETPRVKAWASAQAVQDLEWLGLDWDAWEGDRRRWVLQSERIALYEDALATLKDRELVYPCTCTRSQIETIASAPHESFGDGPVYPGTCSYRSVEDADKLLAEGAVISWRFRMPDVASEFVDEFRGRRKVESLKAELGDFAVARTNGGIAYQLAVVVDDHAMRVQQVVRGDDLLPSTFRQLAVYNALGWQAPTFCHLPLVVGMDGRRLAKRHGDTRLSTYRDHGFQPEAIIGRLACQSGLIDRCEAVHPRELLGIDPLAKLHEEPLVVNSTNFN
jgi:glutamyl-tRNA synthetase